MKANFSIPGEKDWPLAGFFANPKDRKEQETFRQYYRQVIPFLLLLLSLVQLREECGNRVLELAFQAVREKGKASIDTPFARSLSRNISIYIDILVLSSPRSILVPRSLPRFPFVVLPSSFSLVLFLLFSSSLPLPPVLVFFPFPHCLSLACFVLCLLSRFFPISHGAC